MIKWMLNRNYVIFYHLFLSFLLFIVVSCSTMSSISAPTSIVLQSSLSVPLMEETKSLPIFTAEPSSASLLGLTPDQTQTAIFQDSITAQSAERTLVAQYPHVCKNLYASGNFSEWIMDGGVLLQ